jgi:CBS domain containing-hemolysin-like protein
MADLSAILIIGLLIVMNGVFVAGEFALVSLSAPAVARMAAAGHPVAATLRRLRAEPAFQDRYVATCQVGITVASLGLGMYGEHALASRLAPWLAGLGASPAVVHGIAGAIAITGLTYLHIVLGEMVPKSLALIQPERVAGWLMPWLTLCSIAFQPLVLALNRLGNRILQAIGIQRQAEPTAHLSPEELRLVVQESEASGLLRASSGSVLRQLFDFGMRRAEEVMVPRVNLVGLPLDCPPAVLAERVRRSPHNRYPVYRGDMDHILGMVHIKDVLRLLRAGAPLTADVVRPIARVPGTATLDNVLAAFHRDGPPIAVVMDEQGGTDGLITIVDLIEEVTGEIDEGPAPAARLVHLGPDAVEVAGTLRLDEVGDALGMALAHGDVTTVSGLILLHSNGPAAVGDTVTYGGLRFTVTATDGAGVGRARIRRLAGEGRAA